MMIKYAILMAVSLLLAGIVYAESHGGHHCECTCEGEVESCTGDCHDCEAEGDSACDCTGDCSDGCDCEEPCEDCTCAEEKEAPAETREPHGCGGCRGQGCH